MVIFNLIVYKCKKVSNKIITFNICFSIKFKYTLIFDKYTNQYKFYQYKNLKNTLSVFELVNHFYFCLSKTSLLLLNIVRLIKYIFLMSSHFFFTSNLYLSKSILYELTNIFSIDTPEGILN